MSRITCDVCRRKLWPWFCFTCHDLGLTTNECWQNNTCKYCHDEAVHGRSPMASRGKKKRSAFIRGRGGSSYHRYHGGRSE